MSDFPTEIEFLRRVSTAARAPGIFRETKLRELYAEANSTVDFSEWETWADEISRFVVPDVQTMNPEED